MTDVKYPEQFKVSYRYTNPHGSGPFKGSMVMRDRHTPGDYVRAPFGEAVVTSCRMVKPPVQEAS